MHYGNKDNPRLGGYRMFRSHHWEPTVWNMKTVTVENSLNGRTRAKAKGKSRMETPCILG